MEDYNTFCSKVYDTCVGEYVDNVWETLAIDMLPYLFTIDYLNPTEFKSFLIFYAQYAKHADIDTLVINEYLQKKTKGSDMSMDVFMSIINNDVTSLVTILIIMQYFFL